MDKNTLRRMKLSPVGFEAAGLSADCMTLDEIAAELGVSSERVRQIERDALRKLQAALRYRGITPADFA